MARLPSLHLIFGAVTMLVASPTDAEETHWSLQPMVPSSINADAVPKAADSFIDALIDTKRTATGLQNSLAADRHTLLRRLYLVMLGVPPSPATIDAFIESRAPLERDWPRLVDRVLADPRLGERWGQHWLDIIRWAETVGFETNAPRPNAWPYRDWVIQAFNEDKPYDRFVADQLVGDQSREDAALGFLVAGPANLPGQIGRDEQAMRSARQDELDEVIRTVSQAFMGLTVGCARCHDHKFDPITDEDYYSMQALFAGLRYGNRRHRGPANDAWTARVPQLKARLQDLEIQLAARREQYGLRPALQAIQEESFAPTMANAIRMDIAATANGQAASLYEFEVYQNGTNVALASAGSVATASSFALENQTRHPDCLNDGSVDQRQAFPWRANRSGPSWIQIDFPRPVRINRVIWHQGFSLPADYTIRVLQSDTGKWREVAHTRDRFLSTSDTRAAETIERADMSQDDVGQLASLLANIRSTSAQLARYQAGPQVYAASFLKTPDSTWFLQRGDPMQRKHEVQPNIPAVLGRLHLPKQAPEAQRRLTLADHLTAPTHPLTARVMVNRVWQHYFGTGLVETPSDFGLMGRPPSHPRLLDALALDLIEHQWSLKHLHRRLLTSHTFQQSSTPRAQALAIDTSSRLLWRYPPRRADAEVIRDTILAVSGKLNRRQGGVGFDFFAQQGGLSDYQSHETFDSNGWRRMVYARKIRMQAVPILGDFDCPDAGQMTPKRTRSITPLQSLGLMNSPFANRQAAFFAERLRAEVGDEPEAQIKHAIKLAYSRAASPEEVGPLSQLAQEHGLEQVCRVLMNTSEFIYLP